MQTSLRLLTVGALTAIALAFMAPVQAQVNDPIGDTLPYSNGHRVYDLIYTNVAYTATDVTFYARFNNPILPSDFSNPDSVFAGWDLDTDQNAATGTQWFESLIGVSPPVNIGVDYSIGIYGGLFGNPLGYATVFNPVGFVPLGNAPVIFGSDWLQTTVPLSLLGGDDGRMNYFSEFGALGGLGPTDLAPNGTEPAASVAAVPESGSMAMLMGLAVTGGLFVRRCKK